jgi:hypothetical protein
VVIGRRRTILPGLAVAAGDSEQTAEVADRNSVGDRGDVVSLQLLCDGASARRRLLFSVVAIVGTGSGWNPRRGQFAREEPKFCVAFRDSAHCRKCDFSEKDQPFPRSAGFDSGGRNSAHYRFRFESPQSQMAGIRRADQLSALSLALATFIVRIDCRRDLRVGQTCTCCSKPCSCNTDDGFSRASGSIRQSPTIRRCRIDGGDGESVLCWQQCSTIR